MDEEKAAPGTVPAGDEIAPDGEAGVAWSALEGVANESEAALIVGFLQGHGIPARVFDRSFHQTPTSGEDLSSIEVAVPETRLEEARQALALRESAFRASPEGSDTLLTDDGLTEFDQEKDGGC